MWTVDRVWKQKPQGDVWIVHDQLGRKGYFKVPGRNKYYGGTMVANELIAASLARILGFPVAELELARLRSPDGEVRNGIVSLQRHAHELITWKDASTQMKRRPHKYLLNMQKLREIVVFDAWILNTDRGSGKNLILYRDHSEAKWDWYLIDHGNTLYGSPYRWRRKRWESSHWDSLWKYYMVPPGLSKVQSRLHRLRYMINEIQSLPVSTIHDVVHQVPEEYLPSYERDVLLQILLRRQKKLQFIITRWLLYRGRKEYRE